MADNPDWKFETKQIHTGAAPDPVTNARATPIYQTTSYVFNNAEHAQNLFALAEFGNIYTRIQNPTQAVVEERVAALEGGTGALLLASGQSASTFAVLNIAQAGDHFVASSSIYGGTYNLFKYTLAKLGIEVTFVENQDDLDEWRRAIRPNTKLLFAETIGNPKINVLDISSIADIAHEAGALFHTDAVQAAAHLPIDVRALGVDALSVSGHKLGAPKGSGAVFVRAGLPFEPLLHGGGQERGRRSGTENVAWAVALAAACGELAAERRTERGTERGADFIERVLSTVPGSRLTGHRTQRLPGHASFIVPGAGGETVLLELERRGVIASSGSACAAGRTEPSHVLTALGLTTDEASAALRFTWTADVAAAELEASVTALAAAVHAVRPQ